MIKRTLPEVTDADLAEGQDDEQQEKQPVDPIAEQRREIYARATRIRDGEDPDEPEPESAHDANGEEGGEAEPERKPDPAPTRADDRPTTVPLVVGGVVKMVPIDEVQRIAQAALARPVENKVEKQDEPQKPDVPEIDLDKLSEQLVLGDEAERREALQQLRDGIRAQILAELKPGDPAPTRDEINQLVANELQRRETAAREQRALDEDIAATEEAYPALKTDRAFMRLTQEEAFRERAEDLKAYAKRTGERQITVAAVEETIRQAEAGNPEAIRLIAHNHRYLQLKGEKEGKALVRSRVEVFKAAAAKIARSNPNWAKGSEADPTRTQGFDAAIERKKKLVAQPAAAHRKPVMRPPSRQSQQDQNVSPEVSAKRYVERLQQMRGGYVN